MFGQNFGFDLGHVDAAREVMLTANVLTATLTVVDPRTDTLVASLPCDPGCHGVQWGAKQGGGYYAYESSKFPNTMLWSILILPKTAT